MGYWDNKGDQPTKVTWKNPQFVPENKRANGGWYYNPSSGYVERWWSGSGGGGGGQQQQQQQQQRQKIGRRLTGYKPYAQTEYYVSPEQAEKESEAQIEQQGYFKTLLAEAGGDFEKARQYLEEDFTRAISSGEEEQKDYIAGIEEEVRLTTKAKEEELAERGITATSGYGTQERQQISTTGATKKDVYRRGLQRRFTQLGAEKTQDIYEKEESTRRRKRDIEAQRELDRLALAEKIRTRKLEEYERNKSRFAEYEDVYA